MGIAIIAPGKNISIWVETIRELDFGICIQIFPDIEDKEDVEAVMLWQHPKGILDDFPNLKLICSMGAGVDHILSDDSISENLPISRIVDKKLTFSMTNYVIMGILNRHRQINRYQKNQKRKVWDMSYPEIPVSAGVMGVGELGGDIIEKLRMMDIEVSGFGNSPKSNLPYAYYHGKELKEFLSKVNVLVCLLPLTEQTEDFLNYEFFRKCNKGTYLINVARGKHLVEADLLKAIEEGLISGALLDVFRQEPLPEYHPFWECEEITLTPHIASITNPSAAAPQIVDNYNRMKNQRPLINRIDRIKGY
jgi:glyoxylate/hydroxypyruvate reductase A